MEEEIAKLQRRLISLENIIEGYKKLVDELRQEIIRKDAGVDETVRRDLLIAQQQIAQLKLVNAALQKKR